MKYEDAVRKIRLQKIALVGCDILVKEKPPLNQNPAWLRLERIKMKLEQFYVFSESDWKEIEAYIIRLCGLETP